MVNIGDEDEFDVKAARSRSCWSGDRYKLSDAACAVILLIQLSYPEFEHGTNRVIFVLFRQILLDLKETVKKRMRLFSGEYSVRREKAIRLQRRDIRKLFGIKGSVSPRRTRLPLEAARDNN